MTESSTVFLDNNTEVTFTIGDPYQGLFDDIEYLCKQWDVSRSRAICQLIMLGLEQVKIDGRVFTKDQLENRPQIIQTPTLYSKVVNMLTKGNNGDVRTQVNMITIGKLVINGNEP